MDTNSPSFASSGLYTERLAVIFSFNVTASLHSLPPFPFFTIFPRTYQHLRNMSGFPYLCELSSTTKVLDP